MNSPILSNITKTLTGLKSIASKTLESSKTLGKIVEDNIIKKKRTISRSSILARRRAEATKRKDREDLLEASGIRGVVRQTKNAVVRSTKGFLGRIMDFLGTLLIGWALINLPKIIKFAEDLIKRMQAFFGRMNQIVDGIFTILGGFGNMLGAIFSGLITFNFGAEIPRFQAAFQQINLGIDKLTGNAQREINKEVKQHNEFMGGVLKEEERQFPEGQSTQTQPQTETQTGNAGGTAPTSAADQSGGLGTPDTSSSSSSSTSSSPPTTSSSGTKGLLDFISSGEGGYNSMNQGTKGNRIVGSTGDSRTIVGKSLTDMTIGEIMKRQSYLMNPANEQQSNYGLFAVGRYQIIPDTFPGAVSGSGLSESDLFTPANQDKMGMYLIMKKRPYVGQYLKGQHNDVIGAMDALSDEFASIPDPRTGRSKYGSGNKAAHTVEEVRAALERARSNQVSGTRNQTSNLQSNSSPNTSSNIAQSLSPNPRRRSNLAGGKPKPKTQLIATNNTVTKLVPVPVSNGNSNSGAARVNSGGATLPDIQLTSLTT